MSDCVRGHDLDVVGTYLLGGYARCKRCHLDSMRDSRARLAALRSHPCEMVMPREVESFWRKVDKSGECWLWTGARHSTGYGSFTIAGRQQLAHRVAYFASHGAVPDGLEIDHSCRNKRCVRPDHLRLATHKQNMENRDLDSNNTSGYRGVHWRSDKGKWVASVHHNGRNRHLGVFDSAEAAGRCAKQARLALFTHNDADRSHDLAG